MALFFIFSAGSPTFSKIISISIMSISKLFSRPVHSLRSPDVRVRHPDLFRWIPVLIARRGKVVVTIILSETAIRVTDNPAAYLREFCSCNRNFCGPDVSGQARGPIKIKNEEAVSFAACKVPGWIAVLLCLFVCLFVKLISGKDLVLPRFQRGKYCS